MKKQDAKKILRMTRGGGEPAERTVVQEYPLRLTVNEREIATLIASPHQLNFLVAGFLRNQGFVDSLDDFLTLGICHDFGDANVRLSRAVPERLKPTLTSGCGTGISFSLPQLPCGQPYAGNRAVRFSPDAVFALMKDLHRQAEHYRDHGGIHSAALGDGERLLLYAEDIGRHNTLDRIAGEAFFKKVDLAGRMLVTSGRVSTEMVAKAARLGIALIASRTSPTDMAIRMSEEAGITLIGYLRGDSFEVYTHPERLIVSSAPKKIAGVTGVILAGGESRRMGSDKSLLPLDGSLFIEHVYRQMAELFEEVILVTNSPSLYSAIPCRKVPDVYNAQGALAGIHSGLFHARFERAFVVACDMPFLSSEVIRYLCSVEGGDLVIPRSPHGLEPLHALYSKNCLPAIKKVLEKGRKRIILFFDDVDVVEIAAENLANLDPEGLSFRNINTPQEYFALRDKVKPSPSGSALAGEASASRAVRSN